MQAVLVVIFMIVTGAIIGGITNVIVIRMSFHPYEAHYIFNMRIPFTPGLIPERRDEIATKIGQVVEEHLITETLIHDKLNETKTKETVNKLVKERIKKLKSDQAIIRYFAEKFDIKVDYLVNEKLEDTILHKLLAFYNDHQDGEVIKLLPKETKRMIDKKVEPLGDLLCERARVYLSSDKGACDIYDMLDTFLDEKGKIVGSLQTFMTKGSIADRIQHESIRLTNHPKAKRTINQAIDNGYETLKRQPLKKTIDEAQFSKLSDSITLLITSYLNLNEKIDKPLNQLSSRLMQYLETTLSDKVTQLIISQASKHLSIIMQKINLRKLVEDQINTFDLDYIGKLIIEIANRELELIILLGFILGGIIGLFQGLIAISV